jgi:hypothetical protein
VYQRGSDNHAFQLPSARREVLQNALRFQLRERVIVVRRRNITGLESLPESRRKPMDADGAQEDNALHPGALGLFG